MYKNSLSLQLNRVIRRVRESLTMMPCFCPKDAIFVLNKWDMMNNEDEDEKKEFLDLTKEKLRELWEEIDDNNMKILAAVGLQLSLWESILFFMTKHTSTYGS